MTLAPLVLMLMLVVVCVVTCAQRQSKRHNWEFEAWIRAVHSACGHGVHGGLGFVIISYPAHL